jgi:hypothetical protein
MIDLPESEVAIESQETDFVLTSEIVDQFKQAFRWTAAGIPPSFAARAFSGMFEILNRLEVDWKKLLHVSQKFEYIVAISLDEEMKAQSFLKKWKKRGSIHWLHFENQLKTKDGQVRLKAESLIMVED